MTDLARQDDALPQQPPDIGALDGLAFLEDVDCRLRRKAEQEQTGRGEDVHTPIDLSGDAFLEGIADKVAKLIVPRDGDDPSVSQRNFQVFHEKVRTFGERWQRHQNAVKRREQWQARLWRRAKADPRLQDISKPKENWQWDSHYFFDGLPLRTGPWYEMPAKHVPAVATGIRKAMRAKADDDKTLAGMHETLSHIQAEYKRLSPAQRKRDWIRTDPQKVTLDADGIATCTPDGLPRPVPWWRHIGWDDERAVGCWRPPVEMRENPCEWLIAETEQTNVHPHVVVKGLPELDDDRELERRYIVLASIYDNMRRGGRRITAVWPEDLHKWVWGRLSKYREYGPTQGFIGDALSYVQADLKAGSNDGEEAGSTHGKDGLGTSNTTESISVKRDNIIKLPTDCKPMTTSGLAAIFGCSARTIERRIESRALPATKVGRKWRVPIDRLPAEYVQKVIQK